MLPLMGIQVSSIATITWYVKKRLNEVISYTVGLRLAIVVATVLA